MMVNVKLLPRNNSVQSVELARGSTGLELLAKLNLAYDSHILVRKSTPISIDEELNEKDELEIIRVVSGG